MKKKGTTQQDDFFDGISAIAKRMQALHSQAVVDYTPIVEDLIRSKCKDENRIEWTLDHLLDFAGDERIINLYRKLCHYLYSLNPQAAAEYVQFWKEQYDEDEAMFKSGYYKNNPIK
jgi:hypothetical protein